ncbi:MAG TPA: hypothetical protein VK763_03910 [Terriglobales bacterium]|jgi:hypothetical protein|nr:hypothetical protein [Terriglobales bacterium]
MDISSDGIRKGSIIDNVERLREAIEQYFRWRRNHYQRTLLPHEIEEHNLNTDNLARELRELKQSVDLLVMQANADTAEQVKHC